VQWGSGHGADWRPVAKGLILDPALKRATMGEDDAAKDE
jgi:hypothetical protein